MKTKFLILISLFIFNFSNAQEDSLVHSISRFETDSKTVVAFPELKKENSKSDTNVSKEKGRFAGGLFGAFIGLMVGASTESSYPFDNGLENPAPDELNTNGFPTGCNDGNLINLGFGSGIKKPVKAKTKSIDADKKLSLIKE